MKRTTGGVARWVITLAVLVAFLLPSICLAATNMFLKLDGIPGESVDDRHRGEIDVLSYSWGVSNAGATTVSAGGTRLASRADIQGLSITKYLDLASPGLFLWCCNGKHIRSAILTVRNPVAQVEYLKIILEDVIVGSVSSGMSGAEDRPTETVMLYFSKVRYEYTPVGRDGKPQGPVPVTWDLAANKGG